MIHTQDEIIIHLPLSKVIYLFQQPEYFKHWQHGLIDFKYLSGAPGAQGSTRQMRIKMAGQAITMKEEITLVDLPHRWKATYKLKGVINYQDNKFESCSDSIQQPLTNINKNNQGSTRWLAQSQFKFTGMMRWVAKARPQAFEKQTRQHMNDFKIFAENYDFKNDRPT
ncbi:SRPBCC family protein [Nonlabens xiamenensis]|uniref:SRPBCC family protein n=1 Tax=Nonlabens xiamenensis TaxID=2341043 RepID=UPI0013DDB5EE|nr:SRPBCC family protein [Nonlabens xiamenensis]